MPGTPEKPKWAAATITKLAQELARSVKNKWKLKSLNWFCSRDFHWSRFRRELLLGFQSSMLVFTKFYIFYRPHTIPKVPVYTLYEHDITTESKTIHVGQKGFQGMILSRITVLPSHHLSPLQNQPLMNPNKNGLMEMILQNQESQFLQEDYSLESQSD